MCLFGKPNVEKLKSKRDIEGLIKALSYERDAEVRKEAAKALGRIGDDRAVEPLIALLKDEDEESKVRQQAIYSLKDCGNGRTVELLIAALKDKDSEVRGSVAFCLGEIGDTRTLEPVIAALKDTDSKVRKEAAEALEKIGDNCAVEPLIAALKDEDSWVRSRAAYALSTCGDARAVKPLIATLKDKNMWVLKATAYALGRIGDFRAVLPLNTLLDDDSIDFFEGYRDVLREAREALFRIGGLRAVGASGESLSIESEVLLPNDALRALRSRVNKLAVNHPLQQRPDLDPHLDIQLPWISQTLEEAASALESGRDPFGNPITDAQVASGLQKLIKIVSDPEYLLAMDLGYPGIYAPLKRCMEDLEAIVRGIGGDAATASPPQASKGVKTLVSLCTEIGILFPDRYVDQAVEELRQEGELGSRSLALLIRELMECRSPKITHVLEVAGKVIPIPELIDAVRAVAESSELTEAPARIRFTPHIIGGGRVGWTSGTHSDIVAKAIQTEKLLIKHD